MNDTLRIIKLKPHDQIPWGKLREFDFSDHPLDPIQLSNDMQMLVHDMDLVAISGPQIECNFRAFYIRGFDSACFNPKIVDVGEEQIYMDEVTGSIPDLVAKIKRPETIRVRWANAIGETDSHVYTGITARIFQRKMDYLDGVQLISRMNRYHRDKALKAYGSL